MDEEEKYVTLVYMVLNDSGQYGFSIQSVRLGPQTNPFSRLL
jgi:hypothetical protein